MKKKIAIVLVIALIANLVLYAMGWSSALILWAVIIIIGFIAFYALPKMD